MGGVSFMRNQQGGEGDTNRSSSRRCIFHFLGS
jgi:hypothetical protein